MLVDSGKAKQALAIATAVLDADIRVLGADHPQTIRAKLNLSSLYARLKQFDRTLAMQQEVIDVRKRLLGPRHPDTLYVMVNRAGTLHQAGRSGESLAMLRWLLPQAREVLGMQHPQTQAALQVQADDADDLGDATLEIATYRELLDARAASLGADDPRTVDAAWNLEGLLRDGGSLAEADAVRKRYVEPLLAAKPGSLSEAQAKMVENIRRTEAGEARSSAHAAAK
jgi:non-specific serine/threonine protein kinase/serine/threonine-protein kinase